MDIETYFRNKGPFPGLTRAEALGPRDPLPVAGRLVEEARLARDHRRAGKGSCPAHA